MSKIREHSQSDDQIDTLSKTRTPRFYKVLLLNDDFTPMDFVVHVLENIFQHNNAQAIAIMTEVHEKGQGLAGKYTREIAESKVLKVQRMAKEQKYPLRCRMEKD